MHLKLRWTAFLYVYSRTSALWSSLGLAVAVVTADMT